ITSPQRSPGRTWAAHGETACRHPLRSTSGTGVSGQNDDDAYEVRIETRRMNRAVGPVRARLGEGEPERAARPSAHGRGADRAAVPEPQIARGGMTHRVVVGPLHAGADPHGDLEGIEVEVLDGHDGGGSPGGCYVAAARGQGEQTGQDERA